MAEICVSRRFGVPASKMWDRIGDPGRLHEWHPAIQTTEVLDGGERRVNTLHDGGRVSETILDRGERAHSWRIDDSPLPIDDLVATIRVRDESDDACVVEWEATLEPNGVPEAEAVALTRGFFEAGLDAL